MNESLKDIISHLDILIFIVCPNYSIMILIVLLLNSNVFLRFNAHAILSAFRFRLSDI